MTKRIRKAVIPVAGMGTRFLPATRAIPKEMLPIVDTPMLQYIVDEAVRSGIEDVILVTARHKESIENHFDYNYELEDRLEKNSKDDLLKVSKDVAGMCNVISVRQKNPKGLGHAVLMAAPIIGDEPFAVLLGDDLIDSKTPCTQQLTNLFEKEGKSVVGVMEVPESDVSKYGIVGGKKIDDRTIDVDRLVEKPSPSEAPSRFAIPGRYVLTPKIFDFLRETQPGKGGEIQLTDALYRLAQAEGMLAYQFEGDRYDTGDKLGYIHATIEFALRRPELSSGVEALIREYAARLG